MPPKEPPQEPRLDSPEEPEIPALREGDGAPKEGGDIPQLGEAGSRATLVAQRGTQPKGKRHDARRGSSGIGWGGVSIAGLLALCVAIWLGWPALTQRFADLAPEPPAASSNPSMATPPNSSGAYDEARPGFREYHVWMSLSDAPDFSPHASDVIAEVSKTSQAISDLQVVIRIPKQFELDAPKMPSDAFKCGDPNFAVWHQAVTQLIDTLAKQGTRIGQVRSPSFETCDQKAPAMSPGSESRLYRIVIRLESPALP